MSEPMTDLLAKDRVSFSRWASGIILCAGLLGLGGVPGHAEEVAASAAEIAKADAVLWSKPGAAELAATRDKLQQAALSGNDEAQRILGEHLLNGWVLEKDVAKGLEWLEKAAQAGNAQAQADLGQLFLFGDPVTPDLSRASELLEAAAQQGDVAALRVLGEQLIGGWRLPRDAERGQALLQQAIDAGSADAHVALGKLLLHGTGLEEDSGLALEHFEAAAEAGNGHGLAAYGEHLMWQFSSPSKAEAMLQRAGELGASEAWVVLAHGAMYGYLGGGRVSRAKFDGYAEKARAAGEDEIEVLEATRNMWGINMRASGPQTLARLRSAADDGNATAARFLIELLRDGNGLNVRRDIKGATAALESYGALLGDVAQAQYALTLEASKARTPRAYAPVVDAYLARPDLKSMWFAKEILKANPNIAFYILQKRFREDGSYSGSLNGYATRSTLRAVYKACRKLDHPERCNDSVMRPDIVGALLAQ